MPSKLLNFNFCLLNAITGLINSIIKCLTILWEQHDLQGILLLLFFPFNLSSREQISAEEMEVLLVFKDQAMHSASFLVVCVWVLLQFIFHTCSSQSAIMAHSKISGQIKNGKSGTPLTASDISFVQGSANILLYAPETAFLSLFFFFPRRDCRCQCLTSTVLAYCIHLSHHFILSIHCNGGKNAFSKQGFSTPTRALLIKKTVCAVQSPPYFY